MGLPLPSPVAVALALSVAQPSGAATGKPFMPPQPTHHIPVLSQEVVHWLDPRPGQVLVDGTLGGGGHTRLLAERVGSEGRCEAG